MIIFLQKVKKFNLKELKLKKINNKMILFLIKNIKTSHLHRKCIDLIHLTALNTMNHLKKFKKFNNKMILYLFKNKKTRSLPRMDTSLVPLMALNKMFHHKKFNKYRNLIHLMVLNLMNLNHHKIHIGRVLLMPLSKINNKHRKKFNKYRRLIPPGPLRIIKYSNRLHKKFNQYRS